MGTSAAQALRRARELARVPAGALPPFAPERCFARCGIVRLRRALVQDAAAQVDPVPGGAASGPRWILSVDRRVPTHTPQWNGAVALALAHTLLSRGAAGEAGGELAEAVAAELLLPMRPFRLAARRADLTMDGVRDLASRFSAPIRLTIRQWLRSGTWRGYAFLWRAEHGGPVLRWRAASPGERFPGGAALGARAGELLAPNSRLYETLRAGRAVHGVEEVRSQAGTVWWFTRFGLVREDTGGGPHRAVLALVVVDRGR